MSLKFVELVNLLDAFDDDVIIEPSPSQKFLRGFGRSRIAFPLRFQITYRQIDVDQRIDFCHHCSCDRPLRERCRLRDESNFYKLRHYIWTTYRFPRRLRLSIKLREFYIRPGAQSQPELGHVFSERKSGDGKRIKTW